MNRVVITGCGLVSPLGSDVQTVWDGLLAGQSGIQSIPEDRFPGLSTRVYGPVAGYDDADYFEPGAAKKIDQFIRYGVAAADQAVRASGLDRPGACDGARVGVAIGSGIGGLDSIEANFERAQTRGLNRVSPHFIPATIINMVAGHVSMRFGFQGPNISVVTACATGTHNIGLAFQSIASGATDVMVAGGAEYASVMLGLSGFSAMKALSKHTDPKTASRPFDIDRNGFVLSDGAGVVVLESYEHACRRGAPIIAEVVGFGMTADAHHVTQPAPGGLGAIRAMQQAVEMAGCNLNEVDYINAHGTSTYYNDLTEGEAIQSLFGDHARQLLVSSTKSMLGHMLGAAGSVEAIICALALQHQCVPPTMNCHHVEPSIWLDLVQNTAREHTLNYALSNSFGFGGNNATLLLKRCA